MNNKKMVYDFSAKPYQSSSTEDICSWTFVSLPKDISQDIRQNFRWLEEGWGRMKITAKVGNSEWKTAIWFDTKQDTYLLPLKKEIKKKENILLDKEIKIIILV